MYELPAIKNIKEQSDMRTIITYIFGFRIVLQDSLIVCQVSVHISVSVSTVMQYDRRVLRPDSLMSDGKTASASDSRNESSP